MQTKDGMLLRISLLIARVRQRCTRTLSITIYSSRDNRRSNDNGLPPPTARTPRLATCVDQPRRIIHTVSGAASREHGMLLRTRNSNKRRQNWTNNSRRDLLWVARHATLHIRLLLFVLAWNKTRVIYFFTFLPRCMECRRVLTMRFLSVRLSVCLSVRLSVRLSVCQTRALWQNGRKICLDFYIIRKNIYPSFLRRRMVGGGRTLLPEILGQPARVGAKSPILNR